MAPDKEKINQKKTQISRFNRSRMFAGPPQASFPVVLILDKTDPKLKDVQTIIERLTGTECIANLFAEDEGLDVVVVLPVTIDPRITHGVNVFVDRFAALYPLSTIKMTAAQLLERTLP